MCWLIPEASRLPSPTPVSVKASVGLGTVSLTSPWSGAWGNYREQINNSMVRSYRKRSYIISKLFQGTRAISKFACFYFYSHNRKQKPLISASLFLWSSSILRPHTVIHTQIFKQWVILRMQAINNGTRAFQIYKFRCCVLCYGCTYLQWTV